MAGRARNPILGAARARRMRQAAQAAPAERVSAAPEGTPPERATPGRARRRGTPPSALGAQRREATQAPRGLGRSWRQWPPHVRQGTIGAVLLVLGGLGYSGLLARADAASLLAPIGQLLYAVAGWGAFPLMTLLVVDGGLRTGEGMARRALLRPYLFVVALALWLVAVAASQLFFGGATGGMLGAALAAPLRGVPGLVARVGALALGTALLLVLAGVGVREVGRGVIWVVRGGLRRVPWAARPARAAQAVAAPKRARRLAPPPAPRSPLASEEVPARLLLPTAGFPQLEAGMVAWELPPLDLFDAPALGVPLAGASAEEVARRLEHALTALGLEAEVRREEISVGPRVIRLGVRPVERPGRAGQPPSVRTPVSHILRARHELAAALGVRQLRLEAPAHGEPTIGVEVPRPGARAVSLYALLLGDEFGHVAALARLPVALGRDVYGRARALDLADTPHLLLAGADGAEVGAGLRVVLTSLLTRATPEDARLLLVDPGRRALTVYDDLPHLLVPLLVEAEAAVGALHRLLEEAERRQRILTRLGLRDLAAYQHLAGQEGEMEWLPALVVVVAELGDLTPAGAEAERGLCRLAQVGHAAGIHLVLATGHPTPALLTPALRARVPGRVAFAVGSATESRRILEAPGAECLAGQGDLLFLPGESARLERLAGGVVSEEEVARLARFWRRQVVAAPAAEVVGLTADLAEEPGAAWGEPPLSALDQPTIPSQATPGAGALAGSSPDWPHVSRPSGPVGAAAWLPPLPRRQQPSAPAAQPVETVRAGSGGAPWPEARGEEWRPPLPDGWTDELLEDMMQQIRAVIAQGRAPRPPVPPEYPMEEE